MAQKSLFTARYSVLTAIDITVERTDAGGAAGPHTITIPIDDYYILDDGSSDCLLEEIETLIHAAHANYSNVALHLGTVTDGCVSIEAGASEVIVITWTGGALSGEGETLRDRLRFSGTSTTTPGSATNNYVTATRVHWGGYYPAYSLAYDLPEDEEKESVSESDSGVVEKMILTTIQRRRVKVKISGTPRGTTWSEWEAFVDFWRDVCRAGLEFRWYMQDTSGSWIQTAYSRVTNPYGYQTWVQRSPASWKPAPYRQGLHTLFETEWILQLYVS